MRSLNLIRKLIVLSFLIGFVFIPSVLAADDAITKDFSHDILDAGISDPAWIALGEK
jgi:hypothetical protein